MHLDVASRMHPFLRPFVQVMKGLAAVFGDDCEVLLYDLGVLEQSVVACINSHVTGRGIGSPMTGYGLQLINNAAEYANGVHVYMSRADNGVLLKCGVIFLRDERDVLLGLLCIHMDTAKAVAARKLLDQFFSVGESSTEQAAVNEYYGLELEEVFHNMITETNIAAEEPLQLLSKAEKKEIVRSLHGRGFFMMKGAVDFLAQQMGNSKFTIYAYVRDVQREHAEPQGKEGE